MLFFNFLTVFCYDILGKLAELKPNTNFLFFTVIQSPKYGEKLLTSKLNVKQSLLVELGFPIDVEKELAYIMAYKA